MRNDFLQQIFGYFGLFILLSVLIFTYQYCDKIDTFYSKRYTYINRRKCPFKFNFLSWFAINACLEKHFKKRRIGNVGFGMRETGPHFRCTFRTSNARRKNMRETRSFILSKYSFVNAKVIKNTIFSCLPYILYTYTMLLI